MNTILEPAKQLEVTGKYDTVVVGGGFAGVAAALAAARGGNKVLLCERMFILGGLGTAGLVTIYLPLCDGKGHQVSFGIAEELLKLSISCGHEAMYPKPWLHDGTLGEKAKNRYRVRYNAAACAILMEQELLKNGVEILYGTTVCDVLVESQRITHLILENKSGRTAVQTGNVVDCSGDADVCQFAGEDTRVYQQKNVLAAWYYFLNEGKNDLKLLGFADIPNEQKTEEQRKRDEGVKRYVGLDGKELSQMTIDSHAFTFSHFLKNGNISKEYAITNIATIPQVRMTRCIVGAYTMKQEDDHQHFDDSVGMYGNWKGSAKGEVWELPYRTLYGNKIHNLAVAGRCISATDEHWDITRVIPVCSLSGEAAGTAAALGQDFADVDIALLQSTLRKNGVKLHIDEVI